MQGRRDLLIYKFLNVRNQGAEGCDFAPLEGNWMDLHGSRLNINKYSWQMLGITYECLRRTDDKIVMRYILGFSCCKVFS